VEAQFIHELTVPVIEWDASSHTEGYSLWLEAVLADGGEDCRTLCELAGEPLVEGMLVGLPEHTLTVMQRREVSRIMFPCI
jgi:amidase